MNEEEHFAGEYIVLTADIDLAGRKWVPAGNAGAHCFSGIFDGQNHKILGLRIFEDEAGKMNLSVQDIGGEVLAVSQFTLLGDARKGKRPSFIEAARPEIGDPLYEKVVENIRAAGLTCKTGVFRSDMQVELINDGPVTILYDTRRLF